jgi:hypothetical protein
VGQTGQDRQSVEVVKKYYYVMCQKGASIHRAYVQLDPESADILHDSLEPRYDLVQVCDVKPEEVDPELVLGNRP